MKQEVLKKIDEIVKFDVIWNETKIVDYLFEVGYFSYDCISNYIDEDGYEKYISQWYRVTEQLYNNLKEVGIAVITDDSGNYFWGRVSGCSIEEDYALVEVAEKLIKSQRRIA